MMLAHYPFDIWVGPPAPPIAFPPSNTSPFLSVPPWNSNASNEIVVDMVSVVRWMARVSSFCHQYGFSLRFSFSETLPWPSLPTFSPSFHLYFSFSPSLCLSILSSPDRPIRRPRPSDRPHCAPHVAYITNSKDQHRETCCSE